MSLWDAYKKKLEKSTKNKAKSTEILKEKKTKTEEQSISKEKNYHAGHRQRMRTRFEKDPDFDYFTEHEALELFLFNGIPQKDTNVIAHRLIETFGSLSNVFDATIEELLSVKGMTLNAVMMIKETLAMANLYHRSYNNSKINLYNASQVTKFSKNFFMNKHHEIIYAIFLDVNDRLISAVDIGKGEATHSNIDIKRLVRLANARHTVKLILMHNHPSGVLRPSVADLSTTCALLIDLYLNDITLVDHIIFAPDGRYFSFFQNSIMQALVERSNKFIDVNSTTLRKLSEHFVDYGEEKGVMLKVSEIKSLKKELTSEELSNIKFETLSKFFENEHCCKIGSVFDNED